MDVPVNMMQFIGGGSNREIGQQIVGVGDVNKRNSSAITGRGHQSGPKGGFSEVNGINSNHTTATMRGGVAAGGENSLGCSKQPQLMGLVYNR